MRGKSSFLAGHYIHLAIYLSEKSRTLTLIMNMEPPPIERVRLRYYLAAGYVLFIVYGSLSPFTGWQNQGLDFADVLRVPLRVQYTWFDFAVNLLAYVPLGLLFGLTLQLRMRAVASVICATLSAICLSLAMEYAQMYLPIRISSNLDFVANTSGALLGALLAHSLALRPNIFFQLRVLRRYYFIKGDTANFGLALVALWLFAQINPLLPMLGNVFLRDGGLSLFITTQPAPFNWLQSMVVSLNLVMLGMLLLSLLHNRRHLVPLLVLVLCTVALTKLITAAILLKSWALWLWINGESLLGMAAGAALLFATARWSHKNKLRGTALCALLYTVLAHGVMDGDAPASIRQMYQMKYGHLFNYNELSQTAAFVFSLLLLLYLWLRHRGTSKNSNC